ncbi:MAG: CapA family protein [Phyllobacterium sp.]
MQKDNENNDQDELTFYAVGDIGPNRSDPHSIFQHVKPVLSAGDVVFGNLEMPVSNRGTPPPQTGRPLRTPPASVASFADTGFHILSFANNHSVDWGHEALFDTLDHVRGADIAVIGAGRNLAEARRCEIIERAGTKIAFLAYNSILPAGYWAEETRPGCAPLRAWTHYEQVEAHQPGTPAKVHSFAYKDDLAGMVEDVKKARQLADLVFVSMHWGTHFVPVQIADYEYECGHAAVDAGADLIIGHHPHILKGIEVYKGKAIFHSLSNFAFDLEPMWTDRNITDPKILKHIQHLRTLNPDLFTDPECALPYEVRMTGIVKGVIADGKLQSVSFIPGLINKTFEPELPEPDSSTFGDVVAYMKRITLGAGLDTQFEVRDGEMLIRL